MNTRFEAYKISRVIKRSGVELSFFRNRRNEYDEQLDEAEIVGNLKCLYHENSGRVEVERSGAAGRTSIWRTMWTPNATAHIEEIQSIGLQVGDWCDINDKMHTVGGIVDVQQWGIIGTVTLEVMDNGK